MERNRLLNAIATFHAYFARTKDPVALEVSQEIARIADEWKELAESPSRTIDMQFALTALQNVLTSLKKFPHLANGWRETFQETARRIKTHDYTIADKAFGIIKTP